MEHYVIVTEDGTWMDAGSAVLKVFDDKTYEALVDCSDRIWDHEPKAEVEVSTMVHWLEEGEGCSLSEMDMFNPIYK